MFPFDVPRKTFNCLFIILLWAEFLLSFTGQNVIYLFIVLEFFQFFWFFPLQHHLLMLPLFLHQSCPRWWTKLRYPPCRLKWLQFRSFPNLQQATFSTCNISLRHGLFQLSHQQIQVLWTHYKPRSVKCHLQPYRLAFESSSIFLSCY